MANNKDFSAAFNTALKNQNTKSFSAAFNRALNTRDNYDDINPLPLPDPDTIERPETLLPSPYTPKRTDNHDVLHSLEKPVTDETRRNASTLGLVNDIVFGDIRNIPKRIRDYRTARQDTSTGTATSAYLDRERNRLKSEIKDIDSQIRSEKTNAATYRSRTGGMTNPVAAEKARTELNASLDRQNELKDQRNQLIDRYNAAGGKTTRQKAEDYIDEFQNRLQDPLANLDIGGYYLDRALKLTSPDDQQAYDDAHAFKRGIEEQEQKYMRGHGELGQELVQTVGTAGSMIGNNMFFQATGIPAALNTALAPAANRLMQNGNILADNAGAAGALNRPEMMRNITWQAGNAINDIISNPTNIAISASSAINTFDEAKTKGANNRQAFAAALMNGAAEYYSNKMFSGTPLLDNPQETGYVTELIESVAKKLGKESEDAIASFFNNKIVSFIFDKSGEGWEEVITGVLDPLIARITYDPDADFATAEDLMKEWIGGVLLSGIMDIGEPVTNFRAKKAEARQEKYNRAMETRREAVKSGQRGEDFATFARNNANALNNMSGRELEDLSKLHSLGATYSDKSNSSARDFAMVAVNSMGEQGAKLAIEMARDGGYRQKVNDVSAEDYYNEAREIYDQGRTGAKMQNTGKVLSDREALEWYTAGKADSMQQIEANVNTEGVSQNGEQIIAEQSGNEIQERQDRLGTAEQSERLDAGAGESAAENVGRRSAVAATAGETAQRIKAQKTAAEALAKTAITTSTSEQHIDGGTKYKTFKVLDDSTRNNWTDAMKRVTDKAESNGVKVHWFVGKMFINEGNGAFAVRGLNIGDGSAIWIRADADEDIEKISLHELFHTAEKRDPGLKDAIRKRITEGKEDSLLLGMLRQYQDAYRNAGLSDDQMLSEIFADAGAGIDIFEGTTPDQNAPAEQRVRAPQFRQHVESALNESKPTGAKNENAVTMASREQSGYETIPNDVEQTLEKNGATVRDTYVVADSVARIMDSPEYHQPVSVSDLADMASHDTLPDWAKKYINGGGSQEALEAIQRFDDMIWKSITGDFTDAQKLMQALVPSGKAQTDKYGPLRTNVEYRRSFDMDTSCPRTFQFVAYRNAIMKRLNRTLTFDESINLLNLMSAYHQMIPCTYCYVENKRILKAGYYNNFYKFHNAVMNGISNGLAVEDLRPLMYGWDEKKGKLTSAAEKTLTEVWMKDKSGYNPTIAENYHTVNLIRNAAMHLLDGMKAEGKITANTSVNSLTNIIANEYGIKSNGALAEVKKMASDWRYDAGRNAEHVYLVEDIGEEFDKSIADRALELDNEAIRYANSASSAKTVDNYAPYGGELENISEADRKYILGMGGIRKHSSNDFRIDYVLDYFQFFADLAKGKWTGHTYTKNGDYVRIFGLTGDMINMSIAFNDTADGVTENVSEGMEHKLAKELRKAYRNAGVMAMVTSDKQLSYALNADWVDMIIPFHNSGLPKEIWYNMKAWADYTSVQSESLYNGDEMKEALKSRGVDTKGMNAEQVQEAFYETFGLTKAIDTETGKIFAPHFYPYETVQHGVTIPGHGNSKAKYMELCREYGAHPRFDGVIVQDADGNDINVVDHPNYMKLIKETAAADEDFTQPTIEFSFNKPDPYLTEKYGKQLGKKSVTPMDYAMDRLMQEAKNGGYQNAADDQFGIVDEFIKEYAGKGRPLGWLSDRAEVTKDELDTAQDKLVEANREKLREEFKKTEGKKEKPKVRSNFYTNMASQEIVDADKTGEFADDEDTEFVKQLERVRAKLQDIAEHPNQNLGYSFKVFDETPLVYEFATKIRGKRPFVMHAAKAASAMLNRTKNDHGMGVDGLMQVISKLNDPDYIIYQREGRNAGHYAVVVSLDDRSSVAIVDINNYRSGDQGTIDGNPGYYDVLVTAFDKLDQNAAKHFETFEDYILSLLESENNDVVYDKEKDEEALRVAISEQLSGRAIDTSSKNTLSEDQEKVKGNMSSREVNATYNDEQETVGSPLRTMAYTGKTGGNIARMGGVVGKNLGSAKKPWVYFHRNYLNDAMQTANISKADYDKAYSILEDTHPDLAERFNHVTYNANNNSITFGYSPDFDTAREPVAGEQLQVFYDTGKTTYKANNRQIFHHKWLWVEDDYDGFDVKDAWEWSKKWLNTLEPTDEVGGGFAPKGIADGTNIDAWNRQLDHFNLPRDKANRAMYSLDLVEPVQPTNGGWERTHTTPEAMEAAAKRGITMWDVSADEEDVTEKNPTSMTLSGEDQGTTQSYKKVFKYLGDDYQGRILDASSGQGYGTRLGREKYGLDITDIEPYPDDYKYQYIKGVDPTKEIEVEKTDKKTGKVKKVKQTVPVTPLHPEYRDYSALDRMVQAGEIKPYDFIISNAVLNVVPQDQRDALVTHMGHLLAPGGQMFVNVRKIDEIRSLANNPKNVKLGDHEAVESNAGSYQYGFGNGEIVSYLQDVLGDGYTVVDGRKTFGTSSPTALVTKNGTQNMASRETDTRLQQKNIELQQRLDAALADTKLTNGWRAAAKDVQRVAADIIDATSSKESSAIVEQKIRSLVEAASNGGIDSTEMKDLALDIARGLLKRSSVLTTPDATSYDAMRKYLKSVYINVPTEMRKEFTDWKAFAAAHKAMRMKTDGVGIGAVYAELQSKMGDTYFPDLSTDMEKLQQIAEILDNLTPIYDNPYSVNMAEATEETANDILEAILDIGQAEPTYADRAKAREGEVRNLYQQKLAEQKEYLQGRIQEEADKRRDQIEALKQEYADQKKRQRTRKQESADRQKLLRVAKRLQNRKLTAVNRAIVDQLVGDLDTVAVHLTNKTLTNLRELSDWYNSHRDDPNFLTDSRIEAKLERLEKRHISELTIDEVRDLTDVLRGIEKSLADYGKMTRTEDRRLVSEMSKQSQENIRNTKGVAKKNIGDWLVTNTLAPERLIRRLTGYNDSDPLYQRVKELSEGQRRMFDYQMRAEKLFSKWTNDRKLMDKLRNNETVKVRAFVDGKETTVEITPDMRMALYLHSLNDQNLKHIMNGGVRIPDIKLYRAGDTKEAYSRGVTAKLSPDMVRGIANGMSAEERAFANAAHRYFNGMSRDEINAVSEALLGYSLANVENYFPIQTDDAFTQKEIDAIQNDGSIQGMGFTKERVNASNAIYLVPMTDVLKRSIQNHAKYVGMAIPVANMNKLWKANTVDGETDTTSGLKDAMRSKWGDRANDAVEKILTDVQNPVRKTDDVSRALAKVRSNYAGAVLSLNLGVALKQAASYPTAAAVLGWEPLMKAMGNVSKVDLDLIAKYTPLLWYRSQGYSTQEIGDIKSQGGIMDKVLSAHITTKDGREIPLLNWIQGVDLLTTRTLWKASEYYVQQNQKNLKTGSEEYYKAVAEIYNRVIEETQPNYTTMQRPQLLRSENQLLQSFVMFKTQPFQNFNILYDAIGELRAAERLAKNGDSSKLTQAKKNAVNAITSNLVSAAVFAAMTMAWALARRKKDKYEDEEGNFSPWKQLGKDVLSSEFGMLPFGSDLYDLLAAWAFDQKYYGMSNITADSISGALDSTKTAFDAIKSVLGDVFDGDPETKADPEKLARKLFAAAQDASKLLGVPLDNVVNLMTAVYANVASGVNGEYVTAYNILKLTKGFTSSANKGKAYDLLYKAYKTGDNSYEDLLNAMLEDFDEDDIKSAMENRMKKAEGVSKVSALEQRWLPPTQRAEYDALSENLASTKAYKKADNVMVAELEKAMYNYVVQNDNGLATADKISGGEYAGLDADEYFEYLLALKVVDKPNEKGKYGTYSNDEYEAAIDMVAGLNDAERAYLWSLNHSSDKNNPYGTAKRKAPEEEAEEEPETKTKTASKKESEDEMEDVIDVSNSTAISDARYDPKTQTAYITFKSTGRTYSYDGITKEEWEKFKNAPSKGSYVRNWK